MGDIHIGVITSSLGGHGGYLCSEDHTNYWNETQNDRGQLIARGPSGGDARGTYAGSNFLAWDPQASKNPPGEADPSALVENLQDLIHGAGEQGCGYEASLEAWYRFLIEPEPPQTVVFDQSVGESVPQGLDEVLLAQRAQFLRPDSLVAIIMLTDENDCSIMDWGHGHYAAGGTAGALPRSTSVCDTDPNDQCCMACTLASIPEGCPPPSADSKCQVAEVHAQIAQQDDALNLRF